MADMKYSYSISGDFPNQAVAPGKLAYQIEQSSIASAGFLRVDVPDQDGDDCDIWFDDPLSAPDQATLDGLVAAHDGVPVRGPIVIPEATLAPQSSKPGQAWWDPSVGAIKSYNGSDEKDLICGKYLDAYYAGGGQSISGTPIDIETDSVRITEPLIFDKVSATELEFVRAGRIFVIGAVTVQQTAGNGRTITRGALQHRPSGGSYAELPGSGARLYTRNSSDGNFGTLILRCALLVGVGDRLKMVAQRTDGSGTLNTTSNEVNFLVEWQPE